MFRGCPDVSDRAARPLCCAGRLAAALPLRARARQEAVHETSTRSAERRRARRLARADGHRRLGGHVPRSRGRSTRISSPRSSSALDLDGSVYVTDNFAGTLQPHRARRHLLDAVHDLDAGQRGRRGLHVPRHRVLRRDDRATGSPAEEDRPPRQRQPARRPRRPRGVDEPRRRPAATASPICPQTARRSCRRSSRARTTGGAYTGEVYSHPYATLGTPIGTVVADAGANALLTVDARGKVRTLATLPAQPSVVGDWATTIGLPAVRRRTRVQRGSPCRRMSSSGPTAGSTSSLLPGGPEFPARGRARLGGQGEPVHRQGRDGGHRTRWLPPTSRSRRAATSTSPSCENDRISVIKKGSSTPRAVPRGRCAGRGRVVAVRDLRDGRRRSGVQRRPHGSAAPADGRRRAVPVLTHARGGRALQRPPFLCAEAAALDPG